MAKSQPNIDDVKLLQEALATKLEAITKDMVEGVLTGEIDSHTHDYSASNHNHGTTYLGINETATDSDKLDGKHLSDVVNGTTNYISKFTSANTIGNSQIYDDGTNIGIGTTTPSEKLQVDGSIKANGYKVGSGADTKLLTDGGGTKLISDFAQLEDGKIKTTNLPDYLLGQVIYGGSINSQTCTLSSLYKDKFDTTDTTKLLSNLNASSHVGVYFIASESFMLNGTIDVQTGDWVISDGNTWGKIDNTDAVASVNNKTGVVNLNYEDLGAMPIANDVKAGGFKTGYDNILAGQSPEAIAVRVSNYGDDNDGKAFVVIGGNDIKQILGVNNSTECNGDDIFISGLETPSTDDFNQIFHIGSYRVNGTYSNAPKQNCGTSTVDTVVRGTLNVFRSGANDWELIQQLFWVRDSKTEQYQRSYDGTGGTGWIIWKRLIKCDDYADMDGNGGIISSANLQELFRSPDIIQLWNGNGISLAGGGSLGTVYYLNAFSPITVTIENIIEIEGGINIINLNSERVYRVTYDVNCIGVDGKGDVTIRIEDGEGGELYSITEYIPDIDVSKRITFSVMLTNLDYKIIPVIEIESGLAILINQYCYQVSVEEIKFPYFTNPVPLSH